MRNRLSQSFLRAGLGATLGAVLATTVSAQISSVTRRTVQSPAPTQILQPVVNPQAQTQPPVRVIYIPRQPSPQEQAAQLRRIVAFQQGRAEAGFATFQYELGLRYLSGDGVPQSRTRAMEWLSKAAAQDHQQAKAALSKLDRPPTATPAPQPGPSR